MQRDVSIRRAGAGVAVIVAFCASIAWSARTSATDPEGARTADTRGGWIASGETVSRPPGRRPRDRMPAGVLEAFAPAMKLRALLYANDTLWIGTEGGLFCYAPETDTVLAVPGARCGAISSIAIEDDGALWVGGGGGVSVRSGGSWTHYGLEQHRIFARVTEIAPGDERIWIGTYGAGCAAVRDDSITTYTRADSLLDDRVLAVGEESASIVWFGTASGLCRADEQSWQSMRYGSRIPIGAVEDIVFDEAGDIFLAVTRRGVVRYSFGRVRGFGPREGLPGWEIHALSLDPAGRVWAAGAGGLSRFDGSGWVPHRIPELPLAGYRFVSICHDIEGRCYLGTDAAALLVISRERSHIVSMPQRFPDTQVKRIRSFNGDLWMLTERRLYRLHRGLQEYAPPGEWCVGAMSDFCVDVDGAIWVASRFGILRLTGQTWEIFDRRQGLPTDHFIAAALGGAGDVWFGSFDRGMLRFKEGVWIRYGAVNGLPDGRVGEIVVDGEGVVWAIVGEGQLTRFAGDRWETVGIPRPERRTETRGVEQDDSTMALDPAIRFLEETAVMRDDGSLRADLRIGLDAQGRCLVAAPDGIYQPGGSEWRVIEAPEAGGAFDPTAVMVTGRGQMWVGSGHRGAYVRDRGAWIRLGAEDGLSDDHVLSIAEDLEGNVWIGTRLGGINRFTPKTTF